MSYTIKLYQPVERDLADLDDDTRRDIEDEIEQLATLRNPMEHRDVKKLDVDPNLYRLRVGDHRVLFGVLTPDLIVFRVTYRTDRTYSADNMDHVKRLWKQARATAQQ